MVTLTPVAVEGQKKKGFTLTPVDPQQINQRVAQAHDMATQDSQDTRDLGVFNAITEASQSGALLGFDDEIQAGMMTPIRALGKYIRGEDIDIGAIYSDLQNEFDQRKQKRRERHPIASTAGEITGAVAGPGTLASKGLTLAGRVGSGVAANTAALGVEGAAIGAIAGAGDASPGERTQGAKEGAVIGALTGGLLGGGAAALTRRKILKNALPATEDVKAVAGSLYKEAEQQGVRFSQGFYNRLVSSARQAVGRTHSGLHPKTQAALEVLENERGRALSLSEVDEVRQVINNARSGADKADGRLLSKIVDRLDTMVSKARPSDVVSGNGAKGVEYLKEARNLWHKQSKLQIVDDVIEKARNQATGFENGLRVQFRALANNPKRFRQFSKEEQAAIRKIVRGGPIENIIRGIGWMDPRGPFGAVLTGGALVGGGPAGLAIPAAGMVGRKAAEAATLRNVANTQRLIANGQALPDFQAVSPLAGTATRTAVEGMREVLPLLPTQQRR